MREIRRAGSSAVRPSPQCHHNRRRSAGADWAGIRDSERALSRNRWNASRAIGWIERFLAPGAEDAMQAAAASARRSSRTESCGRRNKAPGFSPLSMRMTEADRKRGRVPGWKTLSRSRDRCRGRGDGAAGNWRASLRTYLWGVSPKGCMVLRDHSSVKDRDDRRPFQFAILEALPFENDVGGCQLPAKHPRYCSWPTNRRIETSAS